MTPYQEFIHKSRYARWLEKEGRREDWDETVERYLDFFEFSGDLRRDLFRSIHGLEVMPSMRALMTAGPALRRCNVAGYNCAYLPVDNLRSFDEAMYILMCGTGVGFSVEDKYVSKLPVVSETLEKSDTVIKVGDSKEGWAKSLRELLALLMWGQIPSWDVSGVRPAGARLKTFGGRASGPAPLEDLFHFAINIFKTARGRKLSTLECHDLMCKIGDVVVVGGVRRSAMISLSDLNDDKMRHAKSGNWWLTAPHRALANNSAVYDVDPDMETFFGEWKALYDSKSGERGIFSRAASRQVVERTGRRDPDWEWGTNPCSEIILRPFEFCNLTEVVVRSDDTLESLKKKIELATILGTFQSTLTDFKYLRERWANNCNDERLLGVSLTGICDNLSLITQPALLSTLRETAIEVNKSWASKWGINPSASITCVKPSGTVSQLVDSSSGLHSRHAPYYLRTVRADNKDPLTSFLKDVGIYSEPAVGKEDSTTVFYFPMKSPEGAMTRHNETALSSLELWKLLQEGFCEHKPSATISVREDEWLELGASVFRQRSSISGISFLPYDGGSYTQAPYQELTKEEWDAWIAKHPTPEIDWSLLKDYEKEDHTTASQELACVGNTCELPSN